MTRHPIATSPAAGRSRRRSEGLIRAAVGAALVLVCVVPLAAEDRPDPVESALEHALAAYRAHDTAAAQAWNTVAASLLEHPPGGAAVPEKWVLGNTAQLLPLLDLYTQVAGGRDSTRDAEVGRLADRLHQVDLLNRGPARPAQCAGMRVDYDPFSALVRRIGDVAIDYNPFTLQIRRVGDVAIDYNPFTGQPRRIGPVAVDWDPFQNTVRSLAGVTLH